VKGILAELELKNPEVSILLLDDPQIRDLNREYRKKDKSTDVLSFPMLDETSGNVQPQLLGDIVISVETAEKQAHNRKCALYKELSILLIHGMLHLLGYDHELSKKDEEEMQKQESRIFEGIIKDKKIKDVV
jgi:probable rRNA maturation factor